MCALGCEISHNRGLPVRAWRNRNSCLRAYPRIYAIRRDENTARNRSIISHSQLDAIGAPCNCRGRIGREAIDSRRRAHRFDQRRIELVVLHDPCQRALTKFVGGKRDLAACVAENLHRFDRGNSLRRHPLPDAERAKKTGASGADGVDPCIPIVLCRG